MPFSLSLRAAVFQSTPSARRATVQDIETGEVIQISIHALREEGDLRGGHHRSAGHGNFNPRPPRGGRLCLDVY